MDAVDRAFQPFLEAADQLARAASQAAEAARGDDLVATMPAARLALARLRSQAEQLVARLDDTDARLSVLEEAALTARSLDPDLWPQRRDAIAAKLAADPLDGAATWLAAWARAFLFGCPAETERLITEPFPLPPDAAWCPDRLGTTTDALAARSVQRLTPVLRYLAVGAPLGDRATVPDDLRAHALIMLARLALQAGQPGAADLLEQASAADHHHEAEVLAVRAAMARLGAQAEAADALARQAWKAERCAAAAVEMFFAERGQPPSALDSARALVDELPAIADPAGALDVLFLPVPDEIWLAAAERAAREREFEVARRLADKVGSAAAAPLLAEVAGLRVRIASDTGAEPAARADLLAAAGLASAIAGLAQHAIEQYEEALKLVPGHEDATLGLADALLVEGWGKPLREEAGRLDQAMAMLDASYARHPLREKTSWSLMTHSYLSTALAGQLVPQARAHHIWLAPIAAARAIAFDPSQAQRWVRLADSLSELNCDRAAAVLSSHAMKLDPDDPAARRCRIVTLTNLGHVDEALALIGPAGPDGGEGWLSAVRAILLQISARALAGQAEAERLDQALAAANDALRIEPLNVWYRLVRADLLLRAGKDHQAGEDFEYVWRESQLDRLDGLGFAARAAIELDLGSDAVTLNTQVLELAAATAGDYSVRFNQGAVLVLTGDPQGLPYLDAAVQIAATPLATEYLRTRLDHLTAQLRGKDSAMDLTGVARELDTRAAQIAADTSPPRAQVEAELDRVARTDQYPPEVRELATLAAALTQAWCCVALGDPGAPALLADLAREHPEYPELGSAAQELAAAPPPGQEPAGGQAATGQAQPAPDGQVLQAYLPLSWFAGLADPLDNEIIKRFIPDARARLRRRTGAVLPGVHFRDDAELEPAGFRIVLDGSVAAAGQLRSQRWYCPAHLAMALGGQVRAQLSSAPEAAGPAPFPELGSFPEPADPDPLTVLVAWPPAEVVARRLELAYEAWQAAQPGGEPGP